MINIGGVTESEAREKHARVVDALHATRAAVAEGIVPGGGTALIRCMPVLDELRGDHEVQIGINIIKKAVMAPLMQIVDNAGGNQGSVVVDKVRSLEGNVGYNALTDAYEDLIKSGVIDPVKVTRSALQHASSISGLLLTTDCIIANMENSVKA